MEIKELAREHMFAQIIAERDEMITSLFNENNDLKKQLQDANNKLKEIQETHDQQPDPEPQETD